MRDICVVGASLAGLRAVQALRKHGFEGAITMVGAETHLPYDRPPLSKQVLSGEWDAARVLLTDEAEMKDLEVGLRLGVRATALDTGRGRVSLADGEEIPYDGLVIATGAHPRTLPVPTPDEGVLALRNLEDSLRLREYLARGAGLQVVIVGGGFIGLEVASVCRSAGATVTVVEALPHPLSRVLGDEVGATVGRWHEAHGIGLRTGVSVTRFLGRRELTAVELSDGRILPADVAVVGVGVLPSVDWLQGSALLVDQGVVCDAGSMAAENVAAIGDVARWHHEGYGRTVRIEHWTNASEQAEVAVRNLLHETSDRVSYRPTPYFWSDQLGKRLQFVGLHEAGGSVTLVPAENGEDFVALYASGEALHGALALGSTRDFLRLRRVVTQGGGLREARGALGL